MIISMCGLFVSAKDNSDENLPSPREACNNCYVGNIVHVCRGTSVWVDRIEHKPLFGDTCRVDCYGSYGVNKCQLCGFERDEINFLHACRRFHIDCSLGDERICTYHPWFN